MAEALVLRPGRLDLATIRGFLEAPGPVALDPAAWPAVDRAAEVIAAAAAGEHPVYGVTTGFGSLARTRIGPDQLATLQRNLVLSHAAGTGPLLDDDTVRLILLLKANSLALGYSGIRRNPTGCDAFGMWVSNVLPPCFPAMGICFPSFFGFALNAFDRLDQQQQQVVGPFEEHTDELIQIWDGDTTLQSAADSVGEVYANLALDFDNGHLSPWQYTFSQAGYNEIDAQIISRVYSSASSPLRADLDALRAHLQSKVGLTFGDIFGGDLDQYPGNPGEPIEPAPPTECTYCGGGGGGGLPRMFSSSHLPLSTGEVRVG